ncbi:hypothetical protein GCM10009557_33240 [Virgisporangium ochraceum]|uniref:Uncharacterized protein n=1 Tax=Virgisporangium ochraceum TaxID=65505 RepID=A0A8J3ZSF1_9ACTN|nr:hypothetical protein [Virgisporangium ochraceum]GIJ68866.1 hypothetical protein Voc01_037830 [Virgisporangium ochraceum]
MNTEDLVRLLDERSSHDRLPPGPALYDRIAHRRRRRAAGTAAFAVVLVLVVAAPVLLTRGGGSGGDPVGDPSHGSGRPTNETERTPAAYTGGYRLVDSRASVLPAGNTFTYTFTPTTYDFKLMLWCDSARGSRLRAFIAGRQVETDYCEPAGKRGEFFPGTRSRPVAEKQKFWEDEFGVRVGTPVTVTVRVHTGTDEQPDPEPPTASGVARLLVYEAVPFAEYPFPEPPRSIPRITTDPVMPGETVINYRDAFELLQRDDPVNGYYPFSVTRQPGRDIKLSLDARGPGVLRIVVDQRVEVFMMEYWEWRNAGWSITIDPGLLPAGRSVAVGIYAVHFTAPVWRVTATDVPEQPRGG